VRVTVTASYARRHAAAHGASPRRVTVRKRLLCARAALSARTRSVCRAVVECAPARAVVTNIRYMAMFYGDGRNDSILCLPRGARLQAAIFAAARPPAPRVRPREACAVARAPRYAQRRSPWRSVTSCHAPVQTARRPPVPRRPRAAVIDECREIGAAPLSHTASALRLRAAI